MKSLRKDILKTIANQRGQFISIIIIIALGVSFFVGIQVTGYDMRQVGSYYFEQQSAADFQITTSLGIDNHSMIWLSDQFNDDITIEKVVYFDELVTFNEDQLAVRFYQDGNQLNRYRIIEGRAIQQVNEMLIDSEAGEIGDKLYSEALEQEFTVVGIVESVHYLDFKRGETRIGNGSLSFYGIVHHDVLDDEQYAVALSLRFDSLREHLAYSQDYKDELAKVKIELESLEEHFGQERLMSLKIELEEELINAKQELDAEITKAQKELEDNEILLNEELNTFYIGLNQYNDAISEVYRQIDKPSVVLESPLNSYYTLKSAALRTQTEAYEELNDGQKQIEEGLTSLVENEEIIHGHLQTIDLGLQDIFKLENTLSQLNVISDNLQTTRTAITQINENQQSIYESLQSINESLGLGLVLTGSESDFNLMLTTLTPSSSEHTQVIQLQSQFTTLKQEKTSLEQLQRELNTTLNQSIAQIDNELQINSDAVVSLRDLETKLALPTQKEQLLQQQKTLRNNLTEIQNNRQKLIESEKTLSQQRRQLQSDFSELNEGLNTLEDSASELEDGQEQLYTAQIQLQDAQEDLLNAEKEGLQSIEDGYLLLDDIEEPIVYLSERNQFIYGYQAFEDDSRRIEKIGQVFPLFFFVIAALVSLTTIKRLVDEERTMMGVYRALGYSKNQVRLKILLFSLGTWSIGMLLGILLGYSFIPAIIFNAYTILYEVGDIKLYFVKDILIFPTILAFLSTVGIAVLNTTTLLKKTPAQLMRPLPPQKGQRVWLERLPFVWKRLSFLHKVTVRNIFRNKTRFFMSIVGIAGCTGLLVTGFGFNHSITGIAQKQFLEIQNYDALVAYDPQNFDKEKALFMLDDPQIESVIDTSLITVNIENSKQRNVSVQMSVFDSIEDLNASYSLTNLNGDSTTLSKQGVILTKKAAELLGVNKGDEIKIVQSNDDINVTVKVADVVEYYLEHQVFMHADYADELGIDIDKNAIQLRIKDGDKEKVEQLSSVLFEMEGVYTVANRHVFVEMADQQMESFYIVIVVIVLAAAALSFVVLFNLSSMNITERKRELATLKVLGFYPKETSSYVFRENVILTLLGIVVGIGFGWWLHRFVVLSAELDNFGFIRELRWTAIALSTIMTLIFSYFNDKIMRVRIKKIDMLSALKSVE